MLFNILQDDGRSVEGWVVPNHPDRTPRIRVGTGDENAASIVLDASRFRDDVRKSGIHETGLCGFLVDESNAGKLAAMPDLRIHELETGVLIYRRPALAANYIKGRHFRLETSLIARTKLDAVLQPHFHMNYAAIERLDADTIRAVLGIPYTYSLSASGRVPLPLLDDMLSLKKFKTSVLIGDPFREVLARVLVIQKGEDETRRLDSFAPAKVIERIQSAIRGIPHRNLIALDEALQSLDPEAMHFLADPLTRLLTSNEPGKALHRDAANEAMLRLSRVDAIGLETDPGEYFEVMGAIFAHSIRPNAAMGKGPDPELSEQLRPLASFRRLCRFDGPIYDALLDSVSRLPEHEDGEDAPPPLLTFGADRNQAPARNRSTR
ncbi:MAG: hypothetical protein QM698_16475 [Micropepsaceae bacterium]